MGNRYRGFADWHPNGRNVELLANIEQVLDEYSAHLPLTLRQILYRLVARFDYEKTELAYERLSDLLVNARRGKVIAMDAIRDDDFVERAPACFADEAEFHRAVADWARAFRLDRQQGQPRRLVVWCEASGMVPQLARIADPSCFVAMAEDIEAFAEAYDGNVDFARIAVTAEQAQALGLASALPKPTDKRGSSPTPRLGSWSSLDPADLAAILRETIEARLARAVYDQVLRDEAKSRQGVLSRLGLDQGDGEDGGQP